MGVDRGCGWRGGQGSCGWRGGQGGCVYTPGTPPWSGRYLSYWNAFLFYFEQITFSYVFLFSFCSLFSCISRSNRCMIRYKLLRNILMGTRTYIISAAESLQVYNMFTRFKLRIDCKYKLSLFINYFFNIYFRHGINYGRSSEKRNWSF